MHSAPAIAILALAAGTLAVAPPPAAAPDAPAAPAVKVAPLPVAGPAGKAKPSPEQPTSDSEMAKALARLAAAHQRYTQELSDMVTAFPSYHPSSSIAEGSLHVAGSDTMGPMLASVAIGFQQVYPKFRVNVEQGGSATGIEMLKAGTCDIASVARRLTEQEMGDIAQATHQQVFVVQVGMGAACVYVNADNPLPSMTRSNCNGLFSMSHSMTPAPILRWNQVDKASPLGAIFPPLYVTSRASGTLQVFMDWCMPGEELTTIGCYIERGPSSVVNACCAYREAIGISGFANRQPRARAVAIDAEDGRGPIEPTVANIRNGTYPMSRPLNMVFVATDREHIPAGIREFLRYLLSEDGQDTVADVGNIPAEASQMTDLLGTPVNEVWQ